MTDGYDISPVVGAIGVAVTTRALLGAVKMVEQSGKNTVKRKTKSRKMKKTKYQPKPLQHRPAMYNDMWHK